MEVLPSALDFIDLATSSVYLIGRFQGFSFCTI